MAVQVIGRGFEVGETLTAHVEEAVASGIGRYGADLISSNVVFSRAPHGKILASVMVQVPGHEFFAKIEGADAHSAFNGALDDVQKQLLKELKKSTTKKGA
jgi:ribosomal subunit interface protein